MAGSDNVKKPEGVETLMMACSDASCNFKAVPLKRRAMGPFDVVIDMKYCGVCHSDLHNAAGHMDGIGSKVQYPFVGGHELAGVCTAVGESVTKFKVGDHIGVGCLVDSCLDCKKCKSGEEQHCSKQVGTYSTADNGSGRSSVYTGEDAPHDQTLGGYTKLMVVHEHFGINIPKSYPLEMAGPVMCAGITMYDPMKKAGITEGSKVGIAGLGGLGQMGIKLAKAMGAEVTVISRSMKKKELADKCGADNYVASSDPEMMKKNEGTLDLILNTIPVYHKYDAYNPLLNKKGYQVVLGLHAGLAGALVVNKLTFGKSRVKSSGIGGIPNTQEVIDLCDKNKIYPDIKVVPCAELNEVYGKLDGSNDEGLRYVLDIENTLTADVKCGDAPKIAEATGTISMGRAVKEGLWLLFTGRWR